MQLSDVCLLRVQLQQGCDGCQAHCGILRITVHLSNSSSLRYLRERVGEGEGEEELYMQLCIRPALAHKDMFLRGPESH